MDFPVANLWSLISDTSRLNKAIGLSQNNFEEIDGFYMARQSQCRN